MVSPLLPPSPCVDCRHASPFSNPPTDLRIRARRSGCDARRRGGRVETRVVAGSPRRARRDLCRATRRPPDETTRNHCLRARPGESVRCARDPLAPRERHAVPEQRGTSAGVRSTRVVACSPRRARRGSCRARRRPPEKTTATARVERTLHPSPMPETVAAECRGRQFWPRGGGLHGHGCERYFMLEL